MPPVVASAVPPTPVIAEPPTPEAEPLAAEAPPTPTTPVVFISAAPVFPAPGWGPPG